MNEEMNVEVEVAVEAEEVFEDETIVCAQCGKEFLFSAGEKKFYKEKGLPGERFADTITRLGFENVEKEILSDDILARKDEILKD